MSQIEEQFLMKVSAWAGNASYGIRVGELNRERHFCHSWSSVKVDIDNMWIELPLSSSFWRNCPEIRGKPIASWFQKQGLVPWDKGRPPTFELVPLGERRFRLERS